MHSKEEQKALNKVNDILSKTNIKYVLLTKDESEEDMQSYFSIYSDCSDQDTVYFVRYLFKALHHSAMDYLPDDMKPDPDLNTWIKKIMKTVYKKNRDGEHRFDVQLKKEE